MTNIADGSLGDGSLARSITQSSFDVRKEADVLELLRIVHVHPIEAAIKNHLRDLIFAYRQSSLEEDAQKVRQAFLPLGITIASEISVRAQRPSLQSKTTWGASRPAPHFKRSVTSEKKPDPEASKTDPVAATASVDTPQAAPQTAVEKEAPQQEVAPEVVIPVEVPTQVATAAPVATTDAATRIKEIKRIVNQQVGNPVNLIDAHNEIGREYMNALLQAMKISNGGTQAEVAAAMERLEKAFASVEQVLKEPKEKDVAPQPSTSTPPPTSTSTSTPTSVPTPTPAPAIEETQPLDADAKITVPLERVDDVTPDLVSKEVVTETVPVPQKAVPQTPVMQVAKAPIPKEAPIEATNPQTQDGGMHSVAKEKQLQDLLKANREKEVRTLKQQEEAKIAAMDPLLAPAVTSGLQQLLSEWSLFKSSGIFGTGPSGKDHPLYKKISPLTMAAVIAGRFEGSTPVIKQSITDYMNGWRYEEGVVHEHGETFEHYLRRVVNHILNKQKQK